MSKPLLFLAFVFTTLPILSQPGATSSDEIRDALARKQQLEERSLFKNIPSKNIGPTIMSGRVVDVEANPANPIEFYVGYASGGLWYTQNNGISLIPVMDNSPTQNVGDFAVDWQSGTIWIGTGENNSSRSSYAGIGILKSTDKGRTWQHMGLPDSHHIGSIVINPENNDEVVVGVTGHLYSPNEERGVYKTTDGGKTWNRTLFVSNTAGVIDLVHTPGNFDTQWAATWEKDRKAWNFTGNGAGSAIYKSLDGGTTWSIVSTPQSGFPTGEGIGRIGLAAYDQDTVYAVVDNQNRRDKDKEEPDTKDGLNKEDFKTMSVDAFLKIDDDKFNDFLKKNGFQEKYKAENVKQMVRSGAVKPIDLAKYLEDANSLLFDTPVVGAEVYRSDDGGQSWKKMNEKYIDDLYYSYGYYFGEVRVDPANKDKIYLLGVPLIKSEDGGRSYTSIDGDNVHSDHQALWVDPSMPGHLINGNDGGLNMTYDDGGNWSKLNSTSVGQFYAIAVDNEKPYNVYGGLQDNGVWMGPHDADQDNGWQQSGHHPWKSILGGDGMQVQVDTRNAAVVYTGFQFGNYYRLNLDKDQRTYIQPKHELGEAPYRFNWQTPILLSPHNQDILYLGSNRLHRSLNQGDDWEAISDDLTRGGKSGNVAYGTISTISESPFKFGLLYGGSDDGLIHISQDGGGSWKEVGRNINLPGEPAMNTQNAGLWVSRVVASRHQKERVYATLNGYRWDDFEPYIYLSEDYGATWKNIAADIPASPVNVIIEDPHNENLLFAGTDNGLYASLDRGNSWQLFQEGIPNVAVHDLAIQGNAKHLLVGTHGRGIYKADISRLEGLTPEVLQKALYVYPLEPISYSDGWGNSYSSWSKPNTPGLDVVFYSNSTTTYTARVRTQDNIVVSEAEVVADKGLNIMSYDLAFSKKGQLDFQKKNKKELKEAGNGKTYLPEGKYEVEVSGNGTTENVPFEIKAR